MKAVLVIPATLADDIESSSATKATLSTADAPVIIMRLITRRIIFK